MNDLVNENNRFQFAMSLSVGLILLYSYVGNFLMSYVCLIVFKGIEHYNKWLSPLMDGIFYGTQYIFIIGLSFIIIKSLYAFLGMTVSALIINILCAIQNAQSIKLNLRVLGFDLYQNGEITFYGLIYTTLNPLLILVLAAGICVCLFGNGRLYNNQLVSSDCLK